MNNIKTVAVALRLQFKLSHMVGCLANSDASLLVEAACAVAPSPTAWLEAMAWYGELPGPFGGIESPLIAHSTPKARTNWDLTIPDPVIWIERSRPGMAGLGREGDRVVTYHVDSGAIEITDRAEARHLFEMAGLLAGQAEYPDWFTGPDGIETEVTRSGFPGINDALAERLRELAERAERLETLSRMRQEVLAIDPMAQPSDFDKALAALAAFEAA